MGRILSQDEMHALLSSAAREKLGARSEPADVQPYDLANPPPARRRMPALESIHQHLARSLRPAIARRIGRMPAVSLRASDLVACQSFLDSLPTPVSMHVFDLAPLRGQGLLVFSGQLVLLVVDVLFGGGGRTPKAPPEREWSAVEARVAQRLAEWMVTELAESWRIVTEVRFAYLRSEADLAGVSIASLGDPVVVAEGSIGIESDNAEFWLCYPLAALEPLRTELQGGLEVAPPQHDAAWGRALREALLETPVTVAAELGRRTVPAREVLRLQVGDVLGLPTGQHDPISVRVEGIAKLHGAPGVSRGQNAVRISGSACATPGA